MGHVVGHTAKDAATDAPDAPKLHRTGERISLGAELHVTFESTVTADAVELTAKTNLPEGTLYRLHAERWTQVNDKSGDAVKIRAIQSNAGEFRPVGALEVPSAPSVQPFISVHRFGTVQTQSLRATIALASPELQTLGMDGPRYQTDTEHLYIRGRIDRSVQPPGLDLTWPDDTEALVFTLLLDAPLGP